ncbi:olee1-like protein, partial [Trifolium medium]|nr:olee1-like protein [Trifolium medium]
ICQVVLVKSPRKDCSEVDTDSHLEQAARISVTNNNGIVSPIRTTNPLGFLKKERLPGCLEIFKELGINEDGTTADDD